MQKFSPHFLLLQMSCRSFPKFQVGIIIIISLGALYCESTVKMKSPMDLWLLRSISSSKTSDMSESSFHKFLKKASSWRYCHWKIYQELSVSAYDQNSSDYFYHIFVVLRQGMTRQIRHPLYNPKTWPRPGNCYRNLVNCRYN